MGVFRNLSECGKGQQFAYSFQVADDAMLTDVHKPFWHFCTINKTPYVTTTVTKMRFVGSNSHVFYDNLCNDLSADNMFSKQDTSFNKKALSGS